MDKNAKSFIKLRSMARMAGLIRKLGKPKKNPCLREGHGTTKIPSSRACLSPAGSGKAPYSFPGGTK